MATSAPFQPLMPEEHALGGLLEQASALTAGAYRLIGEASPTLRAALAGHLRAMNSYYTNALRGVCSRACWTTGC